MFLSPLSDKEDCEIIMEQLFNTDPYEVSHDVPAPEILSQEDMKKICDQFYDEGNFWLADELYRQWQNGEDVRRYLGGMGF